MFRTALPASVMMFCATYGYAEQFQVPGLSVDAAIPRLEYPECLSVQGADFCVRFLGCVGSNGVYLEGQARGWNQGTLVGQLNTGEVCKGTWRAGGVMGGTVVEFQCNDGVKGQALFFSEDPETGTGIARGMDSKGRHIKAWSGLRVLEFLGETEETPANLPCTDKPIPIS